MDGFSRYTIRRDGIILNEHSLPIKYFKSNKYLQCYLIDDNNNPHVFGVHSVIAMEYNKKWFPGCVVHHKDEDTHNNHADNLECLPRSKHSERHADPKAMISYVKQNGPLNKGQKMSDDFCKMCGESAKRRGFNGNQFVDKYGNRRS